MDKRESEIRGYDSQLYNAGESKVREARMQIETLDLPDDLKQSVLSAITMAIGGTREAAAAIHHPAYSPEEAQTISLQAGIVGSPRDFETDKKAFETLERFMEPNWPPKKSSAKTSPLIEPEETRQIAQRGVFEAYLAREQVFVQIAKAISRIPVPFDQKYNNALLRDRAEIVNSLTDVTDAFLQARIQIIAKFSQDPEPIKEWRKSAILLAIEAWETELSRKNITQVVKRIGRERQTLLTKQLQDLEPNVPA